MTGPAPLPVPDVYESDTDAAWRAWEWWLESEPGDCTRAMQMVTDRVFQLRAEPVNASA